MLLPCGAGRRRGVQERRRSVHGAAAHPPAAARPRPHTPSLRLNHRSSHPAPPQVLTAVVRKAQLPGTLDGAAAPATAAVPAGAAYR